MKYTPQGQRGVALGVAHDLYRGGAVLEKLAAANERTTFFAQIETRAGVENADAIAAMDGVDCLWVGHFDLSASLGIPGQFEHKDFLDAIDTVVARLPQARQGHRPAGAGCRDGRATTTPRASTSSATRATSGPIRRRSRPASTASAPSLRSGMMSRFKVALSGDFRQADGSPTYPSFDLDAADLSTQTSRWSTSTRSTA